MNMKELEAFRQALKTVRGEYGNSREAAIRLLNEEGVVTPKGKLTKRYAAGVAAVRKHKGQAA